MAYDRPRTWTSWGEFACENLRRENSQDKSLMSLIAKEINDEGMFFGLPSIPDGFRKFSKNSSLERIEGEVGYNISCVRCQRVP